MIASESIERVKEADLIEVLQKVLPADLKFKKAGANYKALSPFTNENTGSFMASPSKNIWKDFSSGKGGLGPISFIMEYKKISWIEAVELVADVCKILIQRIELDEDEKARIEETKKQKEVLEWAAKKFREYFKILPPEHWAKMNLLSRQYDNEGFTEERFQIGYATSNNQEFTNILKENGSIFLGVEAGIISQKENRNFDFFNDRLIFPIQDDKGRVVAFGGRASEAAIKKNSPKYLNSSESKFYDKSSILYGLFQARQEIIRRNAVYLTEGYTDVMAFHDKEVFNTVATCGTALTLEHLKKLKKIASEVILVRDGDQAGISAAYRDLKLCIEANIKVSIVPMPEAHDPDSISREQKENLQQWLDINKQNALLWYFKRLKNTCNNPDDVAHIVSDICLMLMKIKDTIKRKEYAKEAAKICKVPFKDFIEKLELIEKTEKQNQRREKISNDDEKYSLVKKGFPEDGDIEQYKEDGYVISNEEKALYFQAVDNKDNEYFFKGANFILNPLFVIRSAKTEGKRLIEFQNRMGEKTVIALNNKQITNYSLFKEAIVDGYNFTFDAKTTNFHFVQFKNKMLYRFDSATELRTLGQQREGFWAFADGVVVNNNFYKVNEYGVVGVEIEEDKDENIKAFKDMFYLPAFSKVNFTSSEDDDEFESVRKFVFIESEINFNQWMASMKTVYGREKAMIGISFVIAAIFRSIIVNQFGQFPYLFLTGQRQSGKTKFSESLTNLFTPGQKSYDMNTGTMVAFFNRVSKIKDVIVGLEEFTDQIHEVKFQALKAGFDNRSREKGQKTGESNSSVRINSACVITSQYLSVRDDNSLTSRSITESFVEANYTEEQKSEFARLKNFERLGMTSILLELLKHRNLVEAQLTIAIEEINRQLIKDLKGTYMERMLENYVTLMAPVKVLFSKFTFPFSWKEFYDYCADRIISSSDMISDTEGTATFWRILEFLTDKQIIKEDVDFIIEPRRNFKISPSKKEEDQFVYENKNGDKILFLAFNTVHQQYEKEMANRKSNDFIGEATLRGYFKSKPYYIGPIKGLRFKNKATSAYVFNYTEMERLGILNIERDFSNQTQASFPSADKFTQSSSDKIPIIDDNDTFL